MREKGALRESIKHAAAGPAGQCGPRPHRLVRTVYVARAGSFAFCFAVIGVLCWERGYGAGTWAFLALTFLAYPHAAYAHARSARDPKRAERRNLLLDSFLLGIWAAHLGYPLWITFPLLSGTLLNSLVNGGARWLLPSLGLFAFGAALWGAAAGFTYFPDTSPLVTALGFVGSLAYGCLVGIIVHRQTRRIVVAREELRISETRYRLIAENAGDLIAMVDAEGRWRYVSPSYRHMLGAEDLLLGTDAFSRLHPEDKEKAREALRQTLVSGDEVEFSVRLNCADGRTRVLACAGHPVRARSGAATRVVLVSRDITELKASREQLEVAALAFENLLEAIMVSAADGRIVAVNKAFSRITGFSAAEVVGQNESGFRLAMQPAAFYDGLYAEVARQGHWAGSTWARRKDGGVYREWRNVSALRDGAQRIAYFVAVFSEMNGDRREAATAP